MNPFCCVFSICTVGPFPHMALVAKSIRIEGFQVNQWPEKDEASVRRLLTWLKEASLN